jgi:hypothetical protein
MIKNRALVNNWGKSRKINTLNINLFICSLGGAEFFTKIGKKQAITLAFLCPKD